MNKRISENGIDAVGCYSFKFFEVQSSTRFALTEALSLAVASHAVRVAHSTHGYVKSRSEASDHKLSRSIIDYWLRGPV